MARRTLAGFACNIRYGLGDEPNYLLFNRRVGGPQSQRVLAAFQSGEYGVVDQRGTFVLARSGLDGASNAPVIAQLGGAARGLR